MKIRTSFWLACLACLAWTGLAFSEILEQPLVVDNKLGAGGNIGVEYVMKFKNGDMNYGSAGMGSPQHLQAEFFNQLVGLKSNHIPYKGQAQAMNDLIGGQLQYMFSPIQNALPQIQQGRLKALAVASATRHKAMPQVPTLNEQGYQGVELTNWFAVYAPINTPPAVVKKLNAAFIQAGKEPKMKEKLDTLGFESFFTTSEEATDFMRSAIVRWARVAAYAGIKAE